LKTARTFLRMAKNITDQAIAYRPRALVGEYKRRVEPASQPELPEQSVQVAAHSERAASVTK